MSGYIKKALGFLFCLIGILLPWRLRVLYSELLGWIFQGLYLIYFSLIKFISKNLSAQENHHS